MHTALPWLTHALPALVGTRTAWRATLLAGKHVLVCLRADQAQRARQAHKSHVTLVPCHSAALEFALTQNCLRSLTQTHAVQRVLSMRMFCT